MDDQQQRKRPRLDSAEAGATEASLALKEISPHNKGAHRSPSPTTSSTSINMAGSPTSKVTINTRSLQSPTQPCSKETCTSEKEAAPNGVDVTMIPEPSPGNVQDDAISISSSSSPAKSPEIQVAEVEDYDQNDSETRWQPLAGTSGTLGRYHVHQTFPQANVQVRRRSVGKLIPEYSTILKEDDCVEVLRAIQSWLSDLLCMQDQITSDFIDVESDFWMGFPDLISAILRREYVHH